MREVWIPGQVWVAGGSRFHARSDCPGLAEDQAREERRGRPIHPPSAIASRSVLENGEKPCPHCLRGEVKGAPPSPEWSSSRPSPHPPKKKSRWRGRLLAGLVAGTVVAFVVSLPSDFTPEDLNEPFRGECKDEAPIKGFVRKDGTPLYLRPDWRRYDAVDAEVCWVDPQEAREAGYRPPPRKNR